VTFLYRFLDGATTSKPPWERRVAVLEEQVLTHQELITVHDIRLEARTLDQRPASTEERPPR